MQVVDSVVRGCAVGVAFAGPPGDIVEAGCVRNTTFSACKEKLRIARGGDFVYEESMLELECCYSFQMSR
eukprot:tig00000430_g648.t1